jgi:ribonuclease BN (tRNA processing enzyme)
MLTLITLGVGAGKTRVYDGEASSSFLLCVGGEPVLLLDAGLGAAAAALRHHRRLPQHVYISHNHTDHAGELPVMLAVESTRRAAAAEPPLTVLAEREVMRRLRDHRLSELLSTGRDLNSFGRLVDLETGRSMQLDGTAAGLALTPLLARHSEVAFGLLVEYNGVPVLGWTVGGRLQLGLDYRRP